MCIFRDVDDLLTSGTKIEKIITVHPIIEPVRAYLLYVAYDGWIFSGRHVWRVDKISLKEGKTGDYLSHCKGNEAETVLRSGIASEFTLMTGDCAVPAIGPDHYFTPYHKYAKKPGSGGSHEIISNYFPPSHMNNEGLNALLPPPPPPPVLSSTTTGSETGISDEKPKVDEFIMDTKIVQLAQAGDDSDNSIQINDQVAPASVPDKQTLKKTEYVTISKQQQKISDKIEIWDNLAPNAVPDMKSNRPPMSMSYEQYYKKQQQLQQKLSTPTPSGRNPNYTPTIQIAAVTPKPESSSFWPGFLDFFSGSSSSSTTPSLESTGRPTSLKPPAQVYSQQNSDTRLPMLRPIQQLPYSSSTMTSGTNPKQQHINSMHISAMKGKNKPQMITLSTNNGTQKQQVTMHHLSEDEQLTILKVDEEDPDSVASNTGIDNGDNSKENIDINDIANDKHSNASKSDYIVLHKLPNGEALNLENLETYSSMADVESGIKKTIPGHLHPRALLPHVDYDVPPAMEDLIISERPLVIPKLYEPIPLDQLDDLEAMQASQQQTSSPVYIINPLKGDLNVSGEILPPTEEEVEEAIMQANVELFKLNQTTAAMNTTINQTDADSFQERQEKFLNGIFVPTATELSTTSSSTNTEEPSKVYFETQTVVYDFNWTPMPKRPTFGPPRPPPHYKLRVDNIKELSHLAQISIPDSGDLAEEIRRRNNSSDEKPIINVQLLPPRLTAVLFQVNEKHRSLNHHGRYPGMHRQNKIAPIFKVDPTGLDRKRAKSLDNSMFR